jgi:hypothetical protein
MKKIFLILLVFIASVVNVNCQDKLSVSLGMGLPELINAGVRYELQPVKFGVSVGTAFSGAYAISGDIYYHFGGRTNLNDMPPWFFRTNFTYWTFQKFLFINLGEVMMLGFRVGRDFNLTEDFGISIDGGIIPFSFFSGRKIPFSFIPSIGAGVYYRFGS